MFTGSGVALVTPFKKGKIDEAAFRNLVEKQIEAGTHFLVPCGTTGESATLSHEEHNRVIELTVEIAKGRTKVLAGAGSNSTEEAIRLTQYAKKAGADGTLHINPYYNRPTQEGLYRHFEAIAKAVDFPLILYNIPGRTGVNMTPQTMARLANIDCILGVKEASGSLGQVSEIIEFCPKDFVLLSGEDPLTFPMLCLGARGAISVTANLMPKKCVEMFRCVEKNDWPRAREIHYELAPLNRALFIETNPVPVKTALAMMGRISEEVRLPLAPLQKTNREELKKVLSIYDLL
jgi:4-hydroxy-tetrahydrodipicolinate synthase